MTTKAVQDGNAILWTAPTGGASSGDLVEITDMVGVVYDDIASGAQGTVLTTGVFTITKTAHAAGDFAQGDSVYLTTSGIVNNTAAGDQYVGIAWEAALTSGLTCVVNINFGTGA